MNLTKAINGDNLHHAYLIEGRSDMGDELISYLEQNGIKCVGSPNFYRITNPNFGIEDSHNIKFFQSQSMVEDPLSSSFSEASPLSPLATARRSKKIIIIEAESFTNEAQNALLKVFEEPARGSHFFIITPNKDNLLITLQSRMEYARAEKSSPKDNQKEVNFLEEDLKARLDIVKDMIDTLKDKGEEDKNSKNTILEFLNSLETLLYNRYKSERINLDKDKIFIFEEIANCRKYIALRGASVKMLLEHLALVLPRVYN
jgi:DNA polymerase III delta prime subunit